MLTLLYIVIVFFLVFANGFFVASEFALVGVRRSRIEMLATNGSRRARRLLGLLSNLNAYISATQLIAGFFNAHPPQERGLPRASRRPQSKWIVLRA